MTNYLHIETGEYPRHDGDLELLGWNLGNPLPLGWVEIIETQAPVALANETVYEDKPTEVNGVWTQTWIQRQMTTEEIAKRDAPITARAKLAALGLTADEIAAITK